MLARVLPLPLYDEMGSWAGISSAGKAPWSVGYVVGSFGS
jgi:hypothetical protein